MIFILCEFWTMMASKILMCTPPETPSTLYPSWNTPPSWFCISLFTSFVQSAMLTLLTLLSSAWIYANLFPNNFSTPPHRSLGLVLTPLHSPNGGEGKREYPNIALKPYHICYAYPPLLESALDRPPWWLPHPVLRWERIKQWCAIVFFLSLE